jgi:hypothetical protein
MMIDSLSEIDVGDSKLENASSIKSGSYALELFWPLCVEYFSTEVKYPMPVSNA